jgi:hypothetical protein
MVTAGKAEREGGLTWAGANRQQKRQQATRMLVFIDELDISKNNKKISGNKLL